MTRIRLNHHKFVLVLSLIVSLGCQSVKQNTYYEDRLSKERVQVVFAGNEEALTARYGQKFKYQYDSQDSPFVVFTTKRNYDPSGFDLTIMGEKQFLKQYAAVK